MATRLEAGRVQRNFRFQVKANDAVSAEYRVEVLPPPSLVALDSKPSPQLQLFFPAYTGLPSPETLSPGTGNIDAVVGTAVRLRARVDRPLKRAWIEYQPEQPSVVVGDLAGAAGRRSAVVGTRARRPRRRPPYLHDRFHANPSRHVRPALRG